MFYYSTHLFRFKQICLKCKGTRSKAARIVEGFFKTTPKFGAQTQPRSNVRQMRLRKLRNMTEEPRLLRAVRRNSERFVAAASAFLSHRLFPVRLVPARKLSDKFVAAGSGRYRTRANGKRRLVRSGI